MNFDNLFYGIDFIRCHAFRVTTELTANGPEIRSPWAKARQITFVVMTQIVNSGGAVFVTLQGLRIEDGVWENLTEPDGSTDLKFTDVETGFAGKSDTAVVFGTLDLTMMDTDKYKSIRTVVQVTGAGVGKLVSVVAILSDLYEAKTNAADSLWNKQRFGS